MGRFGLLPDEVMPFVMEISVLPGLELEGLWSHFATADTRDKSYAQEQFSTFMNVVQMVEDAGCRIPLRYIANSGVLFDLPEMRLDAVRPGILLYGLRPSDEVDTRHPVAPGSVVDQPCRSGAHLTSRVQHQLWQNVHRSEAHDGRPRARWLW